MDILFKINSTSAIILIVCIFAISFLGELPASRPTTKFEFFIGYAAMMSGVFFVTSAILRIWL